MFVRAITKLFLAVLRGTRRATRGTKGMQVIKKKNGKTWRAGGLDLIGGDGDIGTMREVVTATRAIHSFTKPNLRPGTRICSEIELILFI
jgi:hypothetical protein